MTENDFAFWGAELNPSTPAIDIHGLRAAEAQSKIEYFIDAELMTPHKVVKIIHGAGTGTLRSITHTLLKNNPHVAAWRESAQTHELAAVTYVILK